MIKRIVFPKNRDSNTNARTPDEVTHYPNPGAFASR
ncbi:hypothetical protein BLA17378_01456 [Burkholderia aenigmatica]|uniref:Uncharacterized protein n=1 Tax=Burkholderia aenigmatica TaxID=2015348 RepID=A0ABY6XQM1_9BURK|nr:hypothetical protein BLA17378_01456 [Burkholderia aenigmatica]